MHSSTPGPDAVYNDVPLLLLLDVALVGESFADFSPRIGEGVAVVAVEIRA